MNSEMVICRKVSCKWIGLRDKVLFLLSWLLWAATLFAVWKVELSNSNILTYLGAIMALGGLFLVWSQFNKIYFLYSSRKKGRRPDCKPLESETVAAYFDVKAKYLCGMYGEKHVVISHSESGHVSGMLSQDQPMGNAGVPEYNPNLLSVAA